MRESLELSRLTEWVSDLGELVCTNDPDKLLVDNSSSGIRANVIIVEAKDRYGKNRYSLWGYGNYHVWSPIVMDIEFSGFFKNRRIAKSPISLQEIYNMEARESR